MSNILSPKHLHSGYHLCASVLICALLVAGGCERNHRPQPAADEPPLLLDDEPLLLLNDEEPSETTEASEADNSRCFVCHANYLDEKIAVTHARAGIGCANCHGESDAHIADESWGSGGNGTAPDIMFPMDTIIPSCMRCHPKDKIDIPDHKPVFAQSTEKKVCTDCHGDHRLTVRRCTWK
jgi:hypothetical protein